MCSQRLAASGILAQLLFLYMFRRNSSPSFVDPRIVLREDTEQQKISLFCSNQVSVSGGWGGGDSEGDGGAEMSLHEVLSAENLQFVEVEVNNPMSFWIEGLA